MMFRDIKFDVFQKITICNDGYVVGFIHRFRVLYIKRLYDENVCRIENVSFHGFDELEEYVENNINKCIFVKDIDDSFMKMSKRILKARK